MNYNSMVALMNSNSRGSSSSVEAGLDGAAPEDRTSSDGGEADEFGQDGDDAAADARRRRGSAKAQQQQHQNSRPRARGRTGRRNRHRTSSSTDSNRSLTSPTGVNRTPPHLGPGPNGNAGPVVFHTGNRPMSSPSDVSAMSSPNPHATLDHAPSSSSAKGSSSRASSASGSSKSKKKRPSGGGTGNPKRVRKPSIGKEPPELQIPASHVMPMMTGEIELKEAWARELSGLWQIQAWDFDKERDYNAEMARRKPHCSICYLFHRPRNIQESQLAEPTSPDEPSSESSGSGNKKPASPSKKSASPKKGSRKRKSNLAAKQAKARDDEKLKAASPADGEEDEEEVLSSSEPLPARTRPLAPELCFAFDNHLETPPDDAFRPSPLLGRDGRSPLLTCSSCNVTVHASCYGESEESERENRVGAWKCRRCKSPNMVGIECHLCCLRGGALKQTSCGKWVHIICAMATPEVFFENLVRRERINLSRVPATRGKLKCHFCYNLMRQVNKHGVCVQCCAGRCTTSYHVTCAKAAGIDFEADDWPLPVSSFCAKHANLTTITHAQGTNGFTSVPESDKRPLPKLREKQKVYAKHRNNRYYKAEVVSVSSQMFYHVDFDDGSYSDNLFPEDVQNYDCLRSGPPPTDASVEIKWTDNLIYGGIYRGCHSHPMVTVEFEDGSELSHPRMEVYTVDEKLPKKVLGRLSVASDQKNTKWFKDKPVAVNAKRKRKVPSRFDNEDIVIF